MLRRYRLIPLMLIAAATGLWIGAAFGEGNQETPRQAPPARLNPQSIRLDAQPALASSDGHSHSQIKTIAPQMPPVTEAVDSPENRRRLRRID
jgi:hypothetical protein